MQSATVSGNSATNGSGGGLYIAAGGQASLDNTALTNNQAQAGPGGGITNLGGLTLTASSLVSNTTVASGGAISNTGSLSLLNSSLSGNSASGSAGGLYNNGQASLTRAAVVSNQALGGPGGGLVNRGGLTLTASAVVSNTTIASGGAISNTGALSLLNTTLSGNSASGSAGGLYNNGQAALNFVTVANNTGASGGGLANSGALTLSNTLLADNLGNPFDCSGTVTSLGHNLIGHTAGCPLAGPGTGDKLNLAPLITALIDQGGALRFHDLQDHSPALETTGAACPATDQRGMARPVYPHCDIGAIESAAVGFYYLFLPLLTR